ncbi:MAG: Na+/H+ antiporter subunit E [Actinomycetota bacterium]
MRHRIVLSIWLVVVWVALWRDVSAANIVSGVLVSAGVTWLFPPERRTALTVKPLAMARFIVAVFVSIVRANVVVAWEVLTPSNRINEGVVAVELASSHPVVITLVSHAIVLAPGTMVIDVEEGDADTPSLLFIHVLHLREVEDVRREVLELERLALAAVAGGDEARTEQEDAP